MKSQTQENQPDLFSQPLPEKHRPEPLQELRRSPQPILVHTTLEQIIFYAIVFVLYSCAMFFFGVLRGKSLEGAAAHGGGDSGNSRIVARTQAPPPAERVPAQTLAADLRAPDPPRRSPAPTPTVTADQSKPYTIQLLSHRKKDYADRDAAVLRSAGVFTLVSRKGEYYIVCAGQYANGDEAASDLRSFRKKFKDCFLRRK